MSEKWERYHAFGDKGLLNIATTSSSIDGINLIREEEKKAPYITRTDTNNGIARFVSDKNYELGSDVAGSITIGLDTQTAFYQPYKYVTGQNIQVITGQQVNENTALFLTTVLRNQMGAKFNWGGNGATLNRMKRLEMMLPAKADGTPDWDYMEEYVQSIKRRKIEKYKAYVKKQIEQLEYSDIPSLNEVEWKPFLLSDIFEIKPGKRLVSAHSSEGNIPFIGALDNNNGVARFVSDTNSSLDKNVLGVNYNGNGMVIGFYHPYECIFSDDVKRFHLKNYADGKFVLLFMKVAILMQKKKFGYLYKFNADRMAHTQIMLPAGDDGQPDYGYMEQYSKNLMLRKYEQYLAFTEKKS